MAYTLKEWHEDMQQTDLSTSLVAATEAAEIDDAFFRQVYAAKLNEWVALERDVTEEYIRDLRPESERDALALIKQERADAMKYWKKGSYGFFIAPDAPIRFDEGAAKRAYATIFQRMLRQCERRFPASILSEVADRRLLALDIVSPSVLALARAHDAFFRTKTKREESAAQKRHEDFIKKHPKFKEFHYHDDTIVSFRRHGKDLVMKLDTPVKLIFHEGEIIRSGGRLYGAIWLYEAVRTLEQGYEIEILTYRWTTGAHQSVIRARDVEIIHVPPGTPGYVIPDNEGR